MRGEVHEMRKGEAEEGPVYMPYALFTSAALDVSDAMESAILRSCPAIGSNMGGEEGVYLTPLSSIKCTPARDKRPS